METKPRISHTDKLCLMALAGILITTTAAYELTDGAVIRTAAVDKPPTETAAVSIDCTPLVQAVEASARAAAAAREAAQTALYDEAIPLPRELQAVLRAACEEYGVPLCLALGLIEVESRFEPDSDNGLCYGYCQLNKRYYPDGLTPAENLRAGVAHLGKLLARYGDTGAALCAYNAGHDTGSRTYACAVLAAAERWR